MLTQEQTQAILDRLNGLHLTFGALDLIKQVLTPYIERSAPDRVEIKDANTNEIHVDSVCRDGKPHCAVLIKEGLERCVVHLDLTSTVMLSNALHQQVKYLQENYRGS